MSGVTGRALEDAMQLQSWDPSVKALTSVPQTLEMMNEQSEWMQQLGEVFLSEQEEVLSAVQRLRARADKAGYLETTKQQKVTKAPRPPTVRARPGLPEFVYVIEPVVVEEYYVPVYDPVICYGDWPWPEYRPFYWRPAGFVPTGAFVFTGGVFVGAAIWGGVNWWNRRVFINTNIDRLLAPAPAWRAVPQSPTEQPLRCLEQEGRCRPRYGPGRQDRRRQGEGLGR